MSGRFSWLAVPFCRRCGRQLMALKFNGAKTVEAQDCPVCGDPTRVLTFEMPEARPKR